ncbi:class I SAM-dependent methyltransferase [Roseateles chitinivorans]|uniref:class I SAM-dependent methyltransferase n=1 Tax=Roseateles chitinivorans TaxID=2917965 RepID=UPI003D67C856
MSQEFHDLVFSGTGPGAQTQDGCSVELYRRARYAGEIEHLRPRLPPGTTVLELGCGTGLLTHRLLDFGCEVTGVDNSTDMLAHVSERVRKVHADIEQLALAERFDVVLLPSGLINHADAAVRRAFVAAAARHVAPDGVLILKCQDAQWLRSAAIGHLVRSDGTSIDLVQVDRTPDAQEPRVRMTLKYAMGDDVWTHSFVVVPMDEPAIVQLLDEAGFAAPQALDAKREWFLAGLSARGRRDLRPCPPSPASPH